MISHQEEQNESQAYNSCQESRRNLRYKSWQQKFQIPAKHLRYQLFRMDAVLAIVLAAYIFVDHGPLFCTMSNTIRLNLPTGHSRVHLELFNLILFGFFERWIVLYIAHGVEEWLATLTFTTKTWNVKAGTFCDSTAIRKSLPLSKTIRDKDFQQAQSQPWFHNKTAVLLTITVLLPFDLIARGNRSNYTPVCGILQAYDHESCWTVVEFDMKKFGKEILLGLFLVDLILGTAHMLSHKGPLKEILFKYHAKHHSRHSNYSSVKYVGNPFDFEVFLTQICFAFLPRFIGIDVWTGIFLVNFVSLQLLLEHSGYINIFALSQHHEMHHNHGNVAFYHFPLVEIFLGRMPSLKQLEKNK